jgi:hypothetical protein
MRTQVLVLIALLTLPASQARAQGAPAGSLDPRWSAWIGCWTPSTRAGANQDAQVCIVPAPDAGGIQLISFDGERELLNERFVADGSSQPLSERACSGERASRWAAAGPRLFTSSTARCANQPPIETSRLFALVTRDQWLDIQVSKSGGREQVRTQRFWRSTGEPPAAVANALVQVTPPRTVITAVTVDDVIEASRHLPPNAIEAWLAESSTRVRVDRSALVKLADAKVSTDVIDLMVALAYPRKFEVRRGGGSGGGGFWSGPFDDGFYPGDWGYLADVFTYGFGFGYPYWIGANGYYYYPGGVYVQPGGGGGGAAEEAHGQVVNGLGYTRVQPRAPAHGTAAPGSSASSSGAGGGSDGGSSGSGSSSGSSSGVSSSGYSGGGGGTSTGLTAVPR